MESNTVIAEEKKGVWSITNAILLITFVLLLVGSGLVFYYAPELTDKGYSIKSYFINREDAHSGSYAKLELQIARTKRSIVDLNSKFDKLIPRQPYIIINTTYNTFRLLNYTDTILSGECSTKIGLPLSCNEGSASNSINAPGLANLSSISLGLATVPFQ